MSDSEPTEGNGDVQCRRDAELLRRFVAVRDQDAFEELVRRHGPLVLQVCGQVLSSRQDKEDAFQAAFLTLAARAHKIRSASSLASWLHGVALRVARNLRRQNAVWRKKMDSQTEQFERRQQAATASEVGTNQMHIALSEELDRLPTRYKDAILLCDCEGLSRENAAMQLGVPVGTLATNLRRGRERLRSRLAKSGIAVTTAAVAGTLGEFAKAAAPMSADLILHTARSSVLFRVGQAAGKAVESSTATQLAQSMIRRMTMTNLLKTSALCIAVAAFALLLPDWAQRNLVRAQPQYVFGVATQLPAPLNVPGRWNSSANISTDGFELYLTSDRPPGWGTYVARRAHVSAPFGTPNLVGAELNHGEISHDGLSLYVNDDTRGGFGGTDIFVLKRAAPGAEFDYPENAGSGVNGVLWERWPSVSADGLELYFTRSQGFDVGDLAIWVATRDSTSAPFGNATRLPSTINTGSTSASSISADGLTLFFSSDRPGGFGAWDIWAATRPSRNAAWGTVFNLGPVVNGPLYEWQPSLSGDGSTLYFSRSADLISTSQIWEVPVRVIPEPASPATAAIGLAALGGFVLLRRRAL
jgi:RNA polymerase sigma factor (sigma-70 family)